MRTLTATHLIAALLTPFAPAAHGQGAANQTARQVFAKAAAAVVKIYTYDGSGKPISQGSGFFVSAGGLLATNHHVIAKAASAKVVISGGRSFTVSGIAASLPGKDLALLKVDTNGVAFLEVAEQAPEVGAKVYAIGSPKGLTNTISEGLVSGYRALKNGPTLLQTTAPISSGSSGGPLLSATGRVVGITTAAWPGAQNLNFAVPSRYLRALILLADPLQPLPAGASRVKQPAPEPAGKPFTSFEEILSKVPESILPRNRRRPRAPVEWTDLRMQVFKVWAKEHMTGKRLSLVLTRDARPHLQVSRSKTKPEGSVRLNFSLKGSAGAPSLYELVTILSAESITNLALLERDKMVTISGKIADLGVFLNRGSTTGIIDVARMGVGLQLDDCEVQEWRPSAPKTPVRQGSDEEQAEKALGLAETYLASQKPDSARAILRSIVAKYPQTKAAEIARKHLKRLGGT